MRFRGDGDLTYQIDKILNEGIEFGDNVRGGYVEFESTGGEQEIQHGLGFTPNGFFVIFKDKEADVWGIRLDDWNQETLYLNTSAENVTVRLFVQ